MKIKFKLISTKTLINVAKLTPKIPNLLTKGNKITILTIEEITVETKLFLLSS